MAKVREDIFSALAELLSEELPDVTVVRRDYPVDAAPAYPILMVTEGDETVDSGDPRQPPVWHLEAVLTFVDRDARTDDPPMESVHNFLDKLEAALANEPGEYLSLDGTCRSCSINGGVGKQGPLPDFPFSIAVVSLDIEAIG
jgi:hypothetical protein